MKENPMTLHNAIENAFCDHALEIGISFDKNDIRIHQPEDKDMPQVTNILGMDVIVEKSNTEEKNCVLHFDGTVILKDNPNKRIGVHAICPARL